MKAKRVTVFLLLLMALGSLLVYPTTGTGLEATTQGHAEAPSPKARTIIINELAPIGGSPGSEWVELLNRSGGHALYLPLLLRNARAAAAGGWDSPDPGAAAVGQTGSGLDISGWQVADEDGMPIPSLPPWVRCLAARTFRSCSTGRARAPTTMTLATGLPCCTVRPVWWTSLTTRLTR